MVDNSIPTNQFHPYQAPDAIPHSDISTGGLGSILKKVGIDESKLGPMRNMNIDKARGYAQRNPGKVLGGLSLLAIGLGMLRKRSSR